MTTAWDLFYPRRSRTCRTSDPDHDSDRYSYLNNSRRYHSHYNNNNNHHNRSICFDGSDSFRRSPRPRSSSSHTDRGSTWVDQGSSSTQFVGSNSVSTTDTEPNISRSSRRRLLAANERLPGSVLLARARLLERLGNVSLSENATTTHRRPTRRVSFGIHNRDVDVGEEGLDIPLEWHSRRTHITEATYTTERFPLIQESYKRKPPGLTPQDLECLQMEIFSSLEKGVEVEGEASQVSWDCSICLESFQDGEKLIRLPCDHRFHYLCLDPWVRTCGDCPCCRRDIDVSSYTL